MTGGRFVLDGDVTPEQRAFYHRNGFIVFRQFGSPEEVDALIADAGARQDQLRAGIGLDDEDTVAPTSMLADGRTLWHRLNYFTEYSSTAARISEGRAMQAVAAGLGGPEFWVLRDAMNGTVFQVKTGDRHSRYKEIRWHQDFREGHSLSPAFTAGLYLHTSDRSNGCLAVIPQSHRVPLRHLPRERYYVEVEPGDLVCHHERLYHGSEAMRREGDRRATVYFYLCGGTRPAARQVFADGERLDSIRTLFRDGTPT